MPLVSNHCQVLQVLLTPVGQPTVVLQKPMLTLIFLEIVLLLCTTALLKITTNCASNYNNLAIPLIQILILKLFATGSTTSEKNTMIFLLRYKQPSNISKVLMEPWLWIVAILAV